MNSLENARETIYAQEALLSVKRSAWALYQHELTQTNPLTHRRYTPRKALSNVLRWMAVQKKRGNMAPIELTPTQKQVLRLLVFDGLTQKQIAFVLHKSDRVVRDHFANIRARVGVTSTYQLVAIAVEYGLVAAPRLQK